MNWFGWLEWLTGFHVDVQGASMVPTCPAGCRFRASRLSYLFRMPARGDVVVFRCPAAPDRLDCKRIVGLPHETVGWGRGGVQVNGLPLDEPYARIRPTPPGDDDLTAIQLGPREYFMLGDNRLYSQDSRAYGPVIRSAILGKVVSDVRSTQLTTISARLSSSSDCTRDTSRKEWSFHFRFARCT